MRKTFTKEYMTANCGCYSKERTMSLFFSGGNTSITIDDIINSSIPIRDKYWFVCRRTGLEKKQNQLIAIYLAELVLPLYERRYPDNKAPREAILAAKQFIAGHISLDALIEKRRAAYDAASAADYAAAGNSAYAAAYAAAAGSEADDYAYAAANSAYDAADAEVKKQIEQYLIDFINNQPED